MENSNGLNVPLKHKHIQFLKRIIIPLCKCSDIDEFYTHLTSIFVIFISKDINVGIYILQSLLTYWPRKSSEKQILFIQIISEILCTMYNNDKFEWNKYRHIFIKVIDKLIQCHDSPHSQISETSLLIWSDDSFIKIIDENEKDIIWPKIINAALMAKQSEYTNGYTPNDVLEKFKDRDCTLYQQILDKNNNENDKNDINDINKKKELRQNKWKQIKQIADINKSKANK